MAGGVVPRYVSPALVGGNWNNGVHVGGRYVNLNNLASNTNANIGSRLSYLTITIYIARRRPRPSAEIRP